MITYLNETIESEFNLFIFNNFKEISIKYLYQFIFILKLLFYLIIHHLYTFFKYKKHTGNHFKWCIEALES